jgi:cytochrome c-type biogenesis protein CcmH
MKGFSLTIMIGALALLSSEKPAVPQAPLQDPISEQAPLQDSISEQSEREGEAPTALLAEGATQAPINEDQFREIARSLRCAVCQSESVWESNAELARQMRELIRERLAKGETPEQIKAYFLSRYGDYILMEPRKSGFNWLIWAGPFVVLGVGGIFLYRALRRWVRETGSQPTEPPPVLDERSRERIERELRSHQE